MTATTPLHRLLAAIAAVRDLAIDRDTGLLGDAPATDATPDEMNVALAHYTYPSDALRAVTMLRRIAAAERSLDNAINDASLSDIAAAVLAIHPLRPHRTALPLWQPAALATCPDTAFHRARFTEWLRTLLRTRIALDYDRMTEFDVNDYHPYHDTGAVGGPDDGRMITDADLVRAGIAMPLPAEYA